MCKFFRCWFALSFIGLLLPIICVSVHASASQKMPRKGYRVILPPYEGPIGVVGRRRSQQAAERAALRMLSRLLYWYPEKGHYRIDYSFLNSRGQDQLTGISWVDRERYLISSASSPKAQIIPIDVTKNKIPAAVAVAGPKLMNYAGVTARIIHRTARNGGTFDDMMKYGAVSLRWQLESKLGLQSSVDAGSRATIQALARSIKMPGNYRCSVTWSFKLKQAAPTEYSEIVPKGREIFVNVDYRPDGRFYVNPSEATRFFPEHFYGDVTQRAILKVARKSGTLNDLLHYGATILRLDPETPKFS